MATASLAGLEADKECITIVGDYDLTLRVIEYERVEDADANGDTQMTRAPSKLYVCTVQRDLLARSSDFFRTLLRDEKFGEAQQTVIDLHQDGLASGIIIWLVLLHDTVTTDTYQLEIQDVWYMLLAAHKYGLNPKTDRAKAWFSEWYSAYRKHTDLDYEECQMLLLPCFTFDHAVGFQQATEFLVYHGCRHITEKRPADFPFDHLRLDQSVIQQLNAARGRLKTILHRSLYSPIGKLLNEATCSSKEKVEYGYQKSLFRVGVWPLEMKYMHYSMHTILEKLEEFPGPDAPVVETCKGTRCCCAFNASDTVRSAVSACRDYFDGLCLDCMSNSKPKRGDDDEDYWNHAQYDVRWDADCRVDHSQPTWYFSFMGRRAKMTMWTKQRRTDRD